MTRLNGLVTVSAGRRGKWLVLVVWLILAGALGSLSVHLTSAEKNDSSAYLPAKAESTLVSNELNSFLGKTVPTSVVFVSDSGITSADHAAVASAASQISTQLLGGQPVPPAVPSADGKALLLTVEVPASSDATKLTNSITDVKTIANANANGMTVKVAGAGGTLLDSLGAFKGIDSTLLYVTVLVVALILLITYRSPVLWIFPILAVGVASQCASGLVYLLAKHAGLTVSGQSQGILTVLVFGAGTDYALLLISRYREELHTYDDRHEAMAVALTRAGGAVFASATTVVLSLLCLLFAELNSDKGLGPVCAVGIVMAFLAQMTLLPALLVIFGRWIFWPFKPQAGAATNEASGLWGRISTSIARRPRPVWITTVVILGVLCAGLIGFSASGLTTAQSFRGHPDSVIGQQLIAQHYPAGSSDPAFIVANTSQAQQVAAAAKATSGIASVTPAGVGGDRALLLATFTDAPDSPAAATTLVALRDAVHGVSGADALVGGTTAVNYDVNQAARHDRNVIIPLVLLVVFVVLIVLLRALVAPVLLIATVVLSFAAALGASGWAFTHIFGFAGADTGLPLFVFIFLVALGIDYNIFLMTRVREETLVLGTRAGVQRGLAVTGGVITSAGIVLAATFSVLAVLPLVVLTEIGVAVAFGVLLDTLIVRSVLVPALSLDIGRKIWWPSALATGPE
jgi:putative drug exporter of the RND superfamily